MLARAQVVARVVVRSQRTVQEARGPVTLSTLEVQDAVKGAHPGAVLTLYQVGGAAAGGGRGRWVQGAHRFAVGDEAVVFLTHHMHAGVPMEVLLGLGTGTFTVVRDSDGAVVGLSEAVGDVVQWNAAAAKRPQPRSYASWDALVAALEPGAAVDP